MADMKDLVDTVPVRLSNGHVVRVPARPCPQCGLIGQACFDKAREEDEASKREEVTRRVLASEQRWRDRHLTEPSV